MLNELYARITTWFVAAREESGQGMVEYALILVLVSIAALAALGFLSGAINGVFDQVTTALGGVTS
jgi:pilus assembly protein Flp/PilA